MAEKSNERENLTQQYTKFPSTNYLEASPTREIVENPVSAKCVCANNAIGKPEAGTLQFAKERFAKYGACTCSGQFLTNVRPYNTDYTEKQCQVCQNTFGRVYD